MNIVSRCRVPYHVAIIPADDYIKMKYLDMTQHTQTNGKYIVM